MRLYHCDLTFHDNLFYETRTAGRVFETGRDLHNYALTYALGLTHSTDFHAANVPNYANELARVRDKGVYVTPALGVDITYQVHTFKYGTETDFVREESSNRNRPNFGRAKEIAVNSRFRFGVLSENPLTLPRWIRMGLWMSKARVDVTDVPLRRVAEPGTYLLDVYPLNPIDLPDDAALGLFDLVNMRPSSLTENSEVTATSWWHGQIPNIGSVWLPEGITYG